jgi:hypothetical protein
VAYDAGIINAAFYPTLVITAVATSEITGAWPRFVLSKGWPLLFPNPDETWKLDKAPQGLCCRKVYRGRHSRSRQPTPLPKTFMALMKKPCHMNDSRETLTATSPDANVNPVLHH